MYERQGLLKPTKLFLQWFNYGKVYKIQGIPKCQLILLGIILGTVF